MGNARQPMAAPTRAGKELPGSEDELNSVTGVTSQSAQRIIDLPLKIGHAPQAHRCWGGALWGIALEPTLFVLIESAERGDRSAADALFTALYSELHRVAKRELTRRHAPVSLSATTLLHQAYIEIAGNDKASFPDRGRFMAYASRVMRGLIIDHARNRSAQKRGGQFHITSTGSALEQPADDRELTRISGALDELGKVDLSLAEIVDMKFFCGFTFSEIATLRGISERTAQRQWEKARIYLHRRISMDLEA
jgi:RNA polymerase sigma factor (TIGR02999 family)